MFKWHTVAQRARDALLLGIVLVLLLGEPECAAALARVGLL